NLLAAGNALRTQDHGEEQDEREDEVRRPRRRLDTAEPVDLPPSEALVHDGDEIAAEDRPGHARHAPDDEHREGQEDDVEAAVEVEVVRAEGSTEIVTVERTRDSDDESGEHPCESPLGRHMDADRLGGTLVFAGSAQP